MLAAGPRSVASGDVATVLSSIIDPRRMPQRGEDTTRDLSEEEERPLPSGEGKSPTPPPPEKATRPKAAHVVEGATNQAPRVVNTVAVKGAQATKLKGMFGGFGARKK